MDDKAYTDEWDVGWTVQPYITPFGGGHYTEIVHHPLLDERALALALAAGLTAIAVRKKSPQKQD